ncbi:MAG: iron-sulfur cluster assembly scaffold protein [Steroidobacteraceae bacterium]
MKYNELTRRYFETAAGAGSLSGPSVYRGAAGNRERGTWVQFDLQAAAGKAQDVRFLAFGCPHTIAVSAWVAEQSVGAPLHRRLPCSVQAISERFAVPAEKLGRLLIIEDAWLKAVDAALGAEP